MAQKSSSSLIASLVLCIPLVALAWFLLPMFLPMWRWMNLDFVHIAAVSSTPENQLRREYEFTVRWFPRGDGDPTPYQIISMNPPWGDTPGHTDEENVLIRCVFISERSGSPPSDVMRGGNTYKDTYFKGRGWRLPAGSIPGLPAKRPIVVQQPGELEKVDIGNSQALSMELLDPRAWANDDDDIDDGYAAPGH